EFLVVIVWVSVGRGKLIGSRLSETVHEGLQGDVRLAGAPLCMVDHRECEVTEHVVRFGLCEGQSFITASLDEARNCEEGMAEPGRGIQVQRDLERCGGLVETSDSEMDERRLSMRSRRKWIEGKGFNDQAECFVVPTQDSGERGTSHQSIGAPRSELPGTTERRVGRDPVPIVHLVDHSELDMSLGR